MHKEKSPRATVKATTAIESLCRLLVSILINFDRKRDPKVHEYHAREEGKLSSLRP